MPLVAIMVHLPATQKPKNKWFVYMEEDIPCGFQYVGSTSSMIHRWANTKKKCGDTNLNGTGLESHFKVGCPNDMGDNIADNIAGTYGCNRGTVKES